jgi:hypothetical protein
VRLGCTLVFSAGDKSLLEGNFGQLGNTLDAQLGHDPGAVEFDGLDRNVNDVSNFLIASALDDQLQNLPLAIGKSFCFFT